MATYKKSAAQKGERKLYLKSAYKLNKSYTKEEKNIFKKFGLILFSWVCGYGYRPFRSLLTSLFLIIAFGFTFWIIALNNTQAISFTKETYTFLNCIYFSGITFTTIGYGDILPNVLSIQILSILEGILGVGMLSLFIFSLTKTLTEHIKD
jgi:hypothetical protein